MAKKKDGKEQNMDKQIAVNAQYVKDLSFENPKAPASLIANPERPNIEATVDVQAAKAGDDVYEVSLKIRASAKRGSDIIFLTELTYAGVFTLKNIPEQEMEPALLIFCPNLIFPFARRVVADVTRDGGFPPLMLDPIDFATLYTKKREAAAQKKSASQ